MLRLQPPQIRRLTSPGEERNLVCYCDVTLQRGRSPCLLHRRGPALWTGEGTLHLFGAGGGGRRRVPHWLFLSGNGQLEGVPAVSTPQAPPPRHLAQPQLCPLSGSTALIPGCSPFLFPDFQGPFPSFPRIPRHTDGPGNHDSQKKAIPQFSAPSQNRLHPMHRTSLQAGADAGIQGRLASYRKHG